MNLQRLVWLVFLAALVACGPMQDHEATVLHWTDFDDGSYALATVGDDGSVSTLATGPGRYILSRNGTIRNLEAFVRRQGDTLVHHVPEAGFAVVETSDPAAYRRVADVVLPDATFQRDPVRVEAFEADLGDPPSSGSRDFFFDLQWGHVPVGATPAWAAGVRGADVRVAVIDGGFDLTHPDLAPNINVGLSRNFVDGETLQYCDSTVDYDPDEILCDPDPGNPESDYVFSHGAHVAGTIGAAQNDFGVIGVAPDAELVLLKALSDTGSGSFADVAAAMLYAALVDADIANMSLGALIPQGLASDARFVAELRVLMQRVLNFGTWMGTLYVASAGNEALDLDRTADLVVFPAGLARVVSVSATGPSGWAVDPDDAGFDQLALYSNYGRSAIDVSAPGGDFRFAFEPGGFDVCVVAGVPNWCFAFDFVFSTGNGGWYWSVGTSMAAPHASGVAALILSEARAAGRSLTPAQLERDMYRRAQDLGERGRDPVHGRGAVHSGYFAD